MLGRKKSRQLSLKSYNLSLCSLSLELVLSNLGLSMSESRTKDNPLLTSPDDCRIIAILIVCLKVDPGDIIATNGCWESRLLSVSPLQCRMGLPLELMEEKLSLRNRSSTPNQAILVRSAIRLFQSSGLGE